MERITFLLNLRTDKLLQYWEKFIVYVTWSLIFIIWTDLYILQCNCLNKYKGDPLFVGYAVFLNLYFCMFFKKKKKKHKKKKHTKPEQWTEQHKRSAALTCMKRCILQWKKSLYNDVTTVCFVKLYSDGQKTKETTHAHMYRKASFISCEDINTGIITVQRSH